jgi:hypothetical protein
MMKKTFRNFIIALFYLAGPFLHAQGPASRWYFPNGAGITINSNTVTLATGGQVTSSTTGCSSIADATGNLLFYTDGVTVWNQSHAVMPNGTGLAGNFSLQSAVILKKPSSPNLYYIFTSQTSGSQMGMYYSVVDMSLSSGTGSVITKNAAMYTFSVAGHIGATKHCNGADYWIVGSGVTGIVSFSLSSTGVSGVNLSTGNIGFANAIKFSPNGKLIAFVQNYSQSGNKHRIGLIGFDNATGLASSTYTFIANVSNNAFSVNPLFGCEFSPSGRYLYSHYYYMLCQFDLCSPYVNTNIDYTTLTAVNTNSLEGSASNLQLGPDGKIYVAKAGQNVLGVINSPDLAGNACNYNSAGVSLGTYSSGLSLPNFESSQFEKRATNVTYSSTLNSCLTLTFSPPYPCSITAYSINSCAWNFGEPLSSANTSTLVFPVHNYLNPGTYTVGLIVNYNCNKSDTITQTISVVSPTLSVIGPTLVCGPVTTTVGVIGGSGNYTYSWSPGTSTLASAANLASGNYTVSFYDSANNCRGTGTFSINAVNIVSTFSLQSPLCTNQTNGSATVSASGGIGPYSYTWSPSSIVSPTLNNLAAGPYTVQVKDNGTQCTRTNSLTLASPNPVILSTAAPNYDLCVGATTTLYCSGYGGTASFLYNWANGGSSQTQFFIENQPGTYVYSVSALDGNNCPATATIAVNYFSNPTITLSSATVCAGKSFTLNASGANTYTWQPGGLTSSQITGFGSTTTNYTVTGKNAVCSDSKTTSLSVLALPQASIFATPQICAQQVLTLTAAQANSYTWLGPLNFQSSSQTPTLLMLPTMTGIYSLSVSGSNGCINSLSKLITVIPLPQVSVFGPPIICNGDMAVISASGADVYYSSTLGSFTQTVSVFPNSTATYYFVGSINSSGCQNTASISIQVNKCLGIEEYENGGIKIYPNPSIGIFTIETEEELDYFIYSSSGALIQQGSWGIGRNKIDLENYSAGIYFLKVNSETSTNYVRLVKSE